MEDWEVIEDNASKFMKHCRKQVLENVEKEKKYQLDNIQTRLKYGVTYTKIQSEFLSKNALEYFADDIFSFIRKSLELDESMVTLSVKESYLYCTIDVKKLLETEQNEKPDDELPKLTKQQVSTIKQFLADFAAESSSSAKLGIYIDLMEYVLPSLPIYNGEHHRYTQTAYCKVFDLFVDIYQTSTLSMKDKRMFKYRLLEWKEHLVRIEKTITLDSVKTNVDIKELKDYFGGTSIDDLFTTKRLYEKLETIDCGEEEQDDCEEELEEGLNELEGDKEVLDKLDSFEDDDDLMEK